MNSDRCTLWFLQSTPVRIHFDTKTIENLLSSCQNEFGPVHIVTALMAKRMVSVQGTCRGFVEAVFEPLSRRTLEEILLGGFPHRFLGDENFVEFLSLIWHLAHGNASFLSMNYNFLKCTKFFIIISLFR
jgi:hypothetical protein